MGGSIKLGRETAQARDVSLAKQNFLSYYSTATQVLKSLSSSRHKADNPAKAPRKKLPVLNTGGVLDVDDVEGPCTITNMTTIVKKPTSYLYNNNELPAPIHAMPHRILTIQIYVRGHGSRQADSLTNPTDFAKYTFRQDCYGWIGRVRCASARIFFHSNLLLFILRSVRMLCS